MREVKGHAIARMNDALLSAAANNDNKISDGQILKCQTEIGLLFILGLCKNISFFDHYI